MSNLETLSPADVARLRADATLREVTPLADRAAVEVRVVAGGSDGLPTVEVGRRRWWRRSA